MKIHLAYLALLFTFTITLCFSFPASMYLFASIKALIILFMFMNFGKSGHYSKLYLVLGLGLMAIMIIGVLDDRAMRTRPVLKDSVLIAV